MIDRPEKSAIGGLLNFLACQNAWQTSAARFDHDDVKIKWFFANSQKRYEFKQKNEKTKQKVLKIFQNWVNFRFPILGKRKTHK